MTQNALISQFPFVCPPDPGQTPTTPALKTPFDEKVLIREHTEKRRKYNEYRNVDAALRNQLITAFEGTYLSPLKNAFTGYSGATTLTLLSHLYGKYARILATDLTNNVKELRDPCNTDEPLKSLCTRLNECVDYATAAGKPITEGQVVRISYGLVVKTGQFQEECRTWRAKSDPEKT